MFDKRSYWEDRYVQEHEPFFDWYVDFPQCLAFILPLVAKDSNILIVGCGNSSLGIHVFEFNTMTRGLQVYAQGFRNVVNMDFSPTVIERMKALTADCHGMQWLTLDVTDMPRRMAGCFDLVIDKGTWDAVAYPRDQLAIQKMLWHILKVLRVGGHYLLISSWSPEEFLPYVNLFRGFWDVKHQRCEWYDVYVLTKQRDPPHARFEPLTKIPAQQLDTLCTKLNRLALVQAAPAFAPPSPVSWADSTPDWHAFD
jgi:hypothetical protein